MKKLLVFAILVAAQAGHAATAREVGRDKEDTRARDEVGVSVDAKSDQTRGTMVESTRTSADQIYVDQLATADTRPEVGAQSKALKGLVAASQSPDLTPADRAAVQSAIHEIRTTSAKMHSGAADQVLAQFAKDKGLDEKKIEDGCGGL